MYLEQFALIVEDCDRAIRFFDLLGFEFVEESPSATNDGRGPMAGGIAQRRLTTRRALARPLGQLGLAAQDHET